MLRMPASSDGISPLNWFSQRSNAWRLVRLPSSGGISPLNWFLHKAQPYEFGEAP